MNTSEQQAALAAKELANFLSRGPVEVRDLGVLRSLQERLTRECQLVVESAYERNPEARVAQIEVDAALLKNE
jgi:outer membrane protein TolC